MGFTVVLKTSFLKTRPNPFSSSSPPGNASSKETSNYLRVAFQKDPVCFKASRTLGGACNGSPNSSWMVYSFHSTSIRCSAKPVGSSGAFQSLGGMLQISLLLVKIYHSLKKATVRHIHIILKDEAWTDLTKSHQLDGFVDRESYTEKKVIIHT